jgi:hypothetical protein
MGETGLLEEFLINADGLSQSNQSFSAKKSRKTLDADKEGLPPAPKSEKSRRSRSKSPAVPAMQGPEAHKRAPVVTDPLKSQVSLWHWHYI